MAGRFVGLSTTTATPSAAPVHAPAAQSHHTPSIVRPASTPAPLAGRGGRAEGFGALAPGEGEGVGGSLPRADTFAPLTHGEYNFTGNVSSIIHWNWGTVVQLRVLLGDHGGRQIDWQQTPSDKMTEKGLPFWQRTIINAYGAGGWTWDPASDGSWPGWYDTGSRDARGEPIRAAPYDTFFVRQAPDGLRVPILLDFHVSVDPEPYSKFIKITSVKPHLHNGQPVQAPLPQKVPGWIADGHGWLGTDESLNGKADVVRLDYKQIPLGHCGMATIKDIR